MNRMATVVGLLIVAGAAALGPSSAGPAQEQATLQTEIVSVSLFKNGLGFVRREAEVPKGESRLQIEGLPAPAHGTFWAYSPSGDVTVQELVAFERESVEQLEAVSIAEIVEANVGRAVDLRLTEGEVVRGTIRSVRTGRPPSVQRASRAGTFYSPDHPADPSPVAWVETALGTLALELSSIRQVASVSEPLRSSVERTTRRAVLRLHAQSRRDRGRVAIVYLAKGITWAPSCVIDISDPGIARVTAKAEILNEIEDLGGVPVNLVSGFPNFRFADVTDPIAMRGDLAAFLRSLISPPDPAQGGRRAILTQATGPAPFAGDLTPPYLNEPVEGQRFEELFFYEQERVALARGERGYYPLYAVASPYVHIYEWKIGDVLDAQDRYRDVERGTSQPAGEVWHGIRLTNPSRVPWTTAPAMTVQDGQLLGHDLIYYTSPGAETTVRITQAVDVRAEQAEYEVDRQRESASFHGYRYDLVTVHGELAVTNYKSKEIALSISKELSGEVIDATPQAEVKRLARGLRKVNPRCELAWEVPVRPRDTISIAYRYKVYVRS